MGRLLHAEVVGATLAELLQVRPDVNRLGSRRSRGRDHGRSRRRHRWRRRLNTLHLGEGEVPDTLGAILQDDTGLRHRLEDVAILSSRVRTRRDQSIVQTVLEVGVVRNRD